MINKIDRHLHDKVFNFLLERYLINTNDKTNYFRLRRTNRYNRLSEGFWFHGTEKYMSLSFWTGSDWKNKTPRISFVFSPNGSVWIELAAKESEAHSTFYKKFIINKWKTEGAKSKRFNTYPNKKGEEELYSSKLDYEAWNFKNITTILSKIIKNEKKFIDQQIEKSRTSFLGAVTDVNFIEKTEFETLKENILKYRLEINQQSQNIDLTLGGTTITSIVEVDDTIDRSELHEDALKKKMNERPISLKDLNIIKYKALEGVQIKDLDPDIQWVFFTGENGTGKTSMLEAIAISMNGNIDGNVLLQTDNFEIKSEFHHNNVMGQQTVKRENGKDRSRFTEIENFACYGPNRFDISTSPTITDIDHSGKTYGLFHNDGKLLSIEEAMIKWDFKRIIYLEESYHYSSDNSPREKRLYEKYEKYVDLYLNVKEILLGREGLKIDSEPVSDELHLINRGFLPDVSDMRPIDKDDNDKMYYYMRNNEDPLRFSQLSTGNKSLLALVGDLILRFLEFSKHQKFIDPSEFKGIVLIDEIDAHVHPEWQYQIPSLLSEAFPKIQFIATCHSPLPILGVKDGEHNAAYFKFYRNDEMKPCIEKVNIETSKLTPSSILSSPIFDFRKFLSAGYNYRSGFNPTDDYEEQVFDKLFKKRVQELDLDYKSDEEN